MKECIVFRMDSLSGFRLFLSVRALDKLASLSVLPDCSEKMRITVSSIQGSCRCDGMQSAYPRARSLPMPAEGKMGPESPRSVWIYWKHQKGTVPGPFISRHQMGVGRP